jgi:hypothetical protein
MKTKFLVSALLAMACTCVSAQTGEKSIGISAGIHTDFGIKHPIWGVSFGYGLTDQFRIAPSFEYCAPSHDKRWNIGLEAHYLLLTGNSFTVYPIAGPSLLYDGKLNIGASLGAGFDYALSDHIALVLRAKYQFTAHTDFLLFSAGCNYSF